MEWERESHARRPPSWSAPRGFTNENTRPASLVVPSPLPRPVGRGRVVYVHHHVRQRRLLYEARREEISLTLVFSCLQKYRLATEPSASCRG